MRLGTHAEDTGGAEAVTASRSLPEPSNTDPCRANGYDDVT
ncbi:hypothetical protein ACFWAN_34565 [Streptomyces mirabilis]